MISLRLDRFAFEPGKAHSRKDIMVLEVGNTAQVSVATATLWAASDSPHDADRLALGTPSAVRDWVAGMTRDERVNGLNGRTESQILLGDKVIVTEIQDTWAKVIVTDQANNADPRGYPGWVPLDQLTTDTNTDTGLDHVVSATATSIRDEPDGEVLIPGVSMGTRIQILDEEPYRGWGRAILPGPQQPGWIRMRDVALAPKTDIPAAAGRTESVNLASQFLDVPYVWGGLSAYGVDCSGLVYLVFRQLGISLPRDAGDQAEATRPIKDDEVQAGDLFFFAYPGKPIHHIGLATQRNNDGELTMIHAAGSYGKVVQEAITGDRAETYVGAHSVFAE